jgi:hypothetical protein
MSRKRGGKCPPPPPLAVGIVMSIHNTFGKPSISVDLLIGHSRRCVSTPDIVKVCWMPPVFFSLCWRGFFHLKIPCVLRVFCSLFIHLTVTFITKLMYRKKRPPSKWWGSRFAVDRKICVREISLFPVLLLMEMKAHCLLNIISWSKMTNARKPNPRGCFGEPN